MSREGWQGIVYRKIHSRGETNVLRKKKGQQIKKNKKKIYKWHTGDSTWCGGRDMSKEHRQDIIQDRIYGRGKTNILRKKID